MNYVKEIDGLRAIAVMSVLLFHVEYGFLPGGFVGVDIFFVISGYLITRIIVTEVDAGTFSIKRFYERRIRRIAPALIAMLLGCTLFLIIQPPSETGSIRDSLFAALFSTSNFLFFFTTDYFADTAFNPLLHTWSLSVEEQFYVVLPPALLLLSRGSKTRRRGFLVIAALASLVAAESVLRSNASAAFYLPWLRAWELLAGSLLSTVAIDRIPPQFRPWLTSAGIAAILGACLLFEKSMPFPGASALIPVLGACAVIAGANGRSPINDALGSAPMRFLGKISYSLYLVHWPIICFVTLVQALTPKSQAAICLVSVVLAWASWRWIENPFRERARGAAHVPPQRVFRVFGFCVAGVSLAFVASVALGRSLWNAVPRAIHVTSYLDYQQRDPQFVENPCFLKPRLPDLDAFAAECLRVDSGLKNVLVVGDSHSAHLMTALRRSHPDIRFLEASASGCKPTLSPTGSDYCVNLMRYIFERWLPQSDASVATVLVSASWIEADLPALERTSAALLAMGKRPIIIGPSPQFRAKVPLILAYEAILGTPLSGKLVKREILALDSLLRRDALIAPHYFSLTSTVCPDDACRTWQDDAPMYFDRDHFTVEGATVALAGLRP